MCCRCDFPNLHYIITLSRKEKANNDENRHRCLQFSNLMAHVVLMSSSSFFSLLSIFLLLVGFEANIYFTFSVQILWSWKIKAWYWHKPNAYTRVTEWMSVNGLRPVHLHLTCSQQRGQRQPLQKMVIRKLGISLQKVNVIPFQLLYRNQIDIA